MDPGANLKAQYGGSKNLKRKNVHLVAEHPGKKWTRCNVWDGFYEVGNRCCNDVATFEMDLEEVCSLF